jgi:alkylation response protein AidB-like acyl-CoA dehydrogenase
MLKLINIISKSRISHICRHLSTFSTKWQGGEVVKARIQEDVIRIIEKKPQRLPLVKNFFAQRIDTELLAYPEAILDAEQLEIAKKRKAEYEDFLAANIFDNVDDVNNIRKLKEYGAFQIPTSLVSELSFGVSEVDSKYLSYGTFLNNHQQVMKLINEFGEASQKMKYLPKLESGEITATPCLFEEKRPEDNAKTFSTNAKFFDESDKWILNGEKSYVVMSPAHKDSTLFLVIASAEMTDHVGDFKEGLTALLVDGSWPGVSISRTDETIGLQEKAFNQVSVSFNDVSVPNCMRNCDSCETNFQSFLHF